MTNIEKAEVLLLINIAKSFATSADIDLDETKIIVKAGANNLAEKSVSEIFNQIEQRIGE